MSILHVYNLYDATIETYVSQFFEKHDKLMKRQCEMLYEQSKISHQQNPISAQGSLYRYADNYMMIHTADFDDQTGVYTQLDVPVTILNFGTLQVKDKEKTQSLNTDEKVYSQFIQTNSN